MEDINSGYEQKAQHHVVMLLLFLHGAHSSVKQYCYCFATFPWSPLASVLLFIVYCHEG